MRRIVVGVIFVACLFIIFPYLTSKIKTNQQQHSLNPHKEFQDKRFQTMLEDQEYTLLAMKYGVPIETTKGVLANYDLALWGFSGYDPKKEELMFPEAANTSEVLTAISNKYGVPLNTVASLLIDHKLMEWMAEQNNEQEPTEREELEEYDPH